MQPNTSNGMEQVEEGEYVLGTSAAERERLRLQDDLWGPRTDAFLARCGLAPGMRVLDLGCGPGFVTQRLARAVGPAGSVVALDASARWRAQLEARIVAEGLANVHPVTGRVESADLAEDSFDLVLARWVFSFVPDVAGLVARLARALAPGGVLCVQDYNHEGISLFPRSSGFEAVVRAVRARYAESGGDTFVAGRLPRAFLDAGLELLPPHSTVLCGGPDSAAFRWVGTFFHAHAPAMVAAGLLEAAEHERFLAEWSERERDPASLLFSPIVAELAARKR